MNKLILLLIVGVLISVINVVAETQPAMTCPDGSTGTQILWDDFEDNSINTSLWNYSESDAFGGVTENSSNLQVNAWSDWKHYAITKINASIKNTILLINISVVNDNGAGIAFGLSAWGSWRQKNSSIITRGDCSAPVDEGLKAQFYNASDSIWSANMTFTNGSYDNGTIGCSGSGWNVYKIHTFENSGANWSRYNGSEWVSNATDYNNPDGNFTSSIYNVKIMGGYVTQNVSWVLWYQCANIIDTIPPNWLKNITNDTSPEFDETILFNVSWNDSSDLNMSWFYSNLTGINSTPFAINSSHNITSYNLTINLTIGKDISWSFCANDSSGNTNCTANFSITIVDIRYPYWSSNKTNDTFPEAGDIIRVNATWNEGNQSIFATNITGTWINNSAINLPLDNVTSETLTIPKDRLGLDIGYRWHTNDSNNNVNRTSNFSFRVVDVTYPTYIVGSDKFNDTTPRFNDSINLSVNVSDIFLNQTWCFINITGVNSTPLNINYNTNVSSCNFTNNATNGTDIGWRFYFNDSSGNLNWTINFSFRINNTPPTTAIISYPANNSFINFLNITLNRTSTDADNNPITYLDYINGSLNSTTVRVNSTFNGTDGLWTYYSIAGDNENNASNSTTTIFTLDTTYPKIIYNTTTTNNGTYAQSYIYIRAIANDSNINTVWFWTNSSGNTTMPLSDDLNWWSNVTFSGNGTYQFRVYANDSAGNVNSTDIRQVTLNIANATPTILASASISPIKFYNNFSIIVSVDIPLQWANFTIKYPNGTKYLENVNGTYDSNSGTWNSSVVQANQSGSYLINISVISIYNASSYMEFSPSVLDNIFFEPAAYKSAPDPRNLTHNISLLFYTDTDYDFNFTFNCTMDNKSAFNISMSYKNATVGENTYTSYTKLRNNVTITPDDNILDGIYNGNCTVLRNKDGKNSSMNISIQVNPPAGDVVAYDSSGVICTDTSCDTTTEIDEGSPFTASWRIYNDGNFTLSGCNASLYDNALFGGKYTFSPTNFTVNIGNYTTLTWNLNQQVAAGNYSLYVNIECSATELGYKDTLKIRPEIFMLIKALSPGQKGGGGGGGGGQITIARPALEAAAPAEEITAKQIKALCGNTACEDDIGETPWTCPVDCLNKVWELDQVFCMPLFNCGNWDKAWFINIMMFTVLGAMVLFYYRAGKIRRPI